MTNDRYSTMRPISGEERYVEFDDEFGYWSVFGADSGFCYGQFDSEAEAADFIR